MGDLYDTVYYFYYWLSQDKTDINTASEMKEFWYRLGAYAGILVELVLNAPPTPVSSNTNWTPVAPTDPNDPNSW